MYLHSHREIYLNYERRENRFDTKGAFLTTYKMVSAYIFCTTVNSEYIVVAYKSYNRLSHAKYLSLFDLLSPILHRKLILILEEKMHIVS